MSQDSGAKHGITAALAVTQGEAETPGAAAEQLDLHSLLGLRRVEPMGPAANVVVPLRRGPGRPPGARNKRTEEWIEYLERRYTSPLEVMMQISNMGVEALRLAARCTVLEALDLKLKAAIAAAPYLHAKSPDVVMVPAVPMVEWGGSPEPAGTPGDGAKDVTPAKVIDHEPGGQ